MIRRSIILTGSLLTVVAFRGDAQPPQRVAHALADSSAAQIVARLRSPLEHDGFGAYWLGDILRQRDRAQSRSKLDAIADSLTAEVIRQSNVVRRSDDPGQLNLLAPLGALTNAGHLRSDAGGTPYTGTLDRLIRIHQEAAPNSVIRGVALVYFLCSDFARGLSALREVAVSTDRTASYAMGQMVSVATTKGSCDGTPSPAERQQVLASLRDIFDRRLAQDPEARSNLAALASRQGWTRR
jgi:hypothetical protein